MAPVLRSRSCALLAALLLATGAGVAEAGYGFLTPTNREVAKQQLLTELKALLGHGTSHERLTRLEDVMRPMYMALPKQKDGGLEQGVARYALNRYFLTQRGWHVSGIAPDGEKWNASSSTAGLKSKMPSYILELLEEHMARKHLGLGELAVLAATVEDLVRSDALELLAMAYEAHNFSMNEPLGSEAEQDLVIKTFTLFFTMPWTQESRSNSSSLHGNLKNAHKTNPAWNDNMLWVEDLKGSIKFQESAEHNPFSMREAYFGNYPMMVHLVEQIIDGFGTFQDVQCRELKNLLMDLEAQDRNDGRVLLANFYAPYMQGVHSFFIERPEYLKSLGSLDESDPNRPSVSVPNLIYGRSFCIATENGFQSFCCVDQCNILMESLERSIAQPVASPGRIAELVAGLASDTVAAPRNLSVSLRRKLDSIGEQHGGHVPLHGRLFAQFMHHAFPNECPQPRAPGVTEAPMTHDEWRERRNTSPAVPKEVMKELSDLAAETEGAADQDESCMLWTAEEELISGADLSSLVTPRTQQLHVQEGWLHRSLRLLAMCGAATSLVAILLKSLRSSVSLLWPQGSKKASSRASGHPGTLHVI